MASRLYFDSNVRQVRSIGISPYRKSTDQGTVPNKTYEPKPQDVTERN